MKRTTTIVFLAVVLAVAAPAAAQRFVANGDGTVTDNMTGLIWQQADDGATYSWHAAVGEYHEVTNPGNLDACGNATTGGQTGWQIPWHPDLDALVDLAYNPTIDPVFSLQHPADGYWTATILPHPGLVAAYIDFDDGQTYGGFALLDDGFFELKYVLCFKEGPTVVARDSFENGDFSGWSSVSQ